MITTRELVSLKKPSIPIAAFFALMLLYLGGGVASIPLAILWLAQSLFGYQLIRLFLPRRFDLGSVYLVSGPGYLVGFLATTWLFMLASGGVFGRALVYGLLLFGLTMAVRPSLKIFSDDVSLSNLLVVTSLALFATTWEFPEMVTPAAGLLIIAGSWIMGQLRPRLRASGLTLGLLLFLWGRTRLTTNWFLESDDLANRMAEGIVTVTRGYVSSVGSYPFERYHWLSPVGTALQAELSQSDIVFVFTVFSPLASLIMMMSSLGFLIRSFLPKKRACILLLISGVALLLQWRVQIDTEATVARLATLPALLSLARVAQVGLSTSSRRGRDSLAVFVSSLVLALMLLLFRADLVVFLLMLMAPIAISLLPVRSAIKVAVGLLVSSLSLTVGLIVMKLVLLKVSNSDWSYATLLVEWRPRDLGYCSSVSLAQEILCVVSLNVELWAAFTICVIAVLILISRSSKNQTELTDLFNLAAPAALSYFAFRFTLTSDFPSSVEGFWQIGLLSAHIFILIVSIGFLLEARSAVKSVLAASVIFVAVYLAVIGGFEWFLEDNRFQLDLSSQARFGSVMFQWFFATTVSLLVLGLVHRYVGALPRVLLACAIVIGFIILGIRGATTDRPFSTDVSAALVANVVGPDDVGEVGEWLRHHTPESAVLATNYQCPAPSASKCSRPRPLGESHPRATANWMLMATSRREFLYLSQPFYNPSEFGVLHDLSVQPGTQTVPEFTTLRERGVTYYVAFRPSTSGPSWKVLSDEAVFSTKNFLVLKLD